MDLDKTYDRIGWSFISKTMKALGFGQFCCLDNLSVHSAAVRPSRRATALKNSSRFTRSLPESSAVMPTSRKTTCGFDLKRRLLGVWFWGGSCNDVELIHAVYTSFLSLGLSRGGYFLWQLGHTTASIVVLFSYSSTLVYRNRCAGMRPCLL